MAIQKDLNEYRREAFAITDRKLSLLNPARLKFWKDRSGVLEDISLNLILNKYPSVEPLKINYVWRNKPEEKSDNYIVKAMIKKYNTRDYGVFGFDVHLEVCARHWLIMSEKERVRLLDHELRHLSVRINEDGSPFKDSTGRIVVDIVPHDIVVMTFIDEIEEYGIGKDLEPLAKVILREHKRRSETVGNKEDDSNQSQEAE